MPGQLRKEQGPDPLAQARALRGSQDRLVCDLLQEGSDMSDMGPSPASALIHRDTMDTSLPSSLETSASPSVRRRALVLSSVPSVVNRTGGLAGRRHCPVLPPDSTGPAQATSIPFQLPKGTPAPLSQSARGILQNSRHSRGEHVLVAFKFATANDTPSCRQIATRE